MASRHFIAFGNFALLRDVHPHELVDARRQLVVRFPGKRLDIHDDAARSVRYPQRRIPHFAGFLTENGPEQPLFRRQFGLALRRHFADEDVARPHFRTDADDALSSKSRN